MLSALKNLRLKFEEPEYENLFIDAIDDLSPTTLVLLKSLLEKNVGLSSLYEGKVTMGAKPFAIHLYDRDYPENVISWFYPTKRHINVYLYRGTDYSMADKLVMKNNIKGTPHPIRLKFSKENEIYIVIQAIHKAAIQRNA